MGIALSKKYIFQEEMEICLITELCDQPTRLHQRHKLVSTENVSVPVLRRLRNCVQIEYHPRLRLKLFVSDLSSKNGVEWGPVVVAEDSAR